MNYQKMLKEQTLIKSNNKTMPKEKIQSKMLKEILSLFSIIKIKITISKLNNNK